HAPHHERSSIMPSTTSRTLATVLFTTVAAVSLVACDQRAEEPTAGQRLDATVAQAERKIDDIRSDARVAGNEARQATDQAANVVSDKVTDAAITAQINAELARDSKLSALRVDVDTVGGRVTLRGNAPDGDARDRATTLAQQVSGVRTVDNQLSVTN